MFVHTISYLWALELYLLYDLAVIHMYFLTHSCSRVPLIFFCLDLDAFESNFDILHKMVMYLNEVMIFWFTFLRQISPKNVGAKS